MESILNINMWENIEEEATHLSQCNLFSKPDNIRFDAFWNGENMLGCNELPTCTIQDVLLSLNKIIDYKSEESAVQRFFFSCIQQVYRHQDEDEV